MNTDPRSPHAAFERLVTERKAIASLARSRALSEGDIETALAHIAKVAAEVLDVERASVWQLDETRSRILCVHLFDRASGERNSGMILHREDAPAYFDALSTERNITADDAHHDPRTSELRDNYLVPQGITAMLDAPFFVGGEIGGVVCHEHRGPARTWELWEELVAATFADFAALVFTAAERVSAERALAAHRAHLEQIIDERTQRLSESEAGLRNLFEAAPIALVLSKVSDGSIVMGNRRAAQVFDVPYPSPDGLRAKDFWMSREERRTMMEQVARTGRADEVVVPMRTRTGRDFLGEVTAVRLVFEGEPAMLVGVQDVTRQRKAEDALRELATRDALTGVSNQRHFLELAEAELARASRYGHAVSLALMDADHFKSVNDQHGHATGDIVLKLLAHAARSSLREVDLFARYGGEEFVALLPETSRIEAEGVIERLRRAISSETFETKDGPKNITVSVGLVGRQDGESLVSMLKRADEAMYRAKASGRDRMVLG